VSGYLKFSEYYCFIILINLPLLYALSIRNTSLHNPFLKYITPMAPMNINVKQ